MDNGYMDPGENVMKPMDNIHYPWVPERQRIIHGYRKLSMDARNYIIKSMDISKNENIRQYKKNTEMEPIFWLLESRKRKFFELFFTG